MTEGPDAAPAPGVSDPFRIEFVPGVTPDKWLRVWARRLPHSAVEAVPVDETAAVDHLRDGSAAMALVRLPIERHGLHLIPLYEEVPVVVVAKEHVLSAFEEVDVTDLADEVLMQDPGLVPEWAAVATLDVRERASAMPLMTTKQAISVVATGSGVVVVPLSVARLHHRKDVTHVPVSGVAASGIGLAWRVGDDDPRIEEFIGIVRGRTERSSRGPRTPDASAGRGAPGDGRGSGQDAQGPGARRHQTRTGGQQPSRAQGQSGRNKSGGKQSGRKRGGAGGGPRRKGAR